MNTAVTLGIPSAVGSLESYVQTVSRFPMLSAESELLLAKRLRDEGDLEAARQLVVSHLRLVVAIARGYLGYGLPHNDLIQEGNIGLMKAVKRFDPDRGVRLVSFAIHWIKAEIHEYVIRNWRLVRVATTKAQRKLFFNLRGLKTGLDSLKQSEIKLIARKLNVKPEEVAEMEMRLSGQEMALESDNDDDSYAPIAYLVDGAPEPEHAAEARQEQRNQSNGLSAALSSLDDRSRRIIEARWLREEDTATLHELATEFNVSAERIRQIEAKALNKMKGLLEPDRVNSDSAA